ncbi:MAG: glycosyltransferase [Patescibacteria group bacterium]|nr:glycosyltransferase [Patescibacteria group bacterium]
MIENKKIAIVYDWFDKWGGVERVLLTLAEIFPQAIFYTSYYDKNKAFWAKKFKIKTSFIQKIPKFIKTNRVLSVPFYSFAFENLNLDEFDLVISITSSFSKGIITKPKTKHICYLLTPTRFLWTHEKDYILKIKNLFFLKKYINYLKKWDIVASQRPDKIICISKTSKERCEKYYKRKSMIIYPPFDIDYWKKIKILLKNNYKSILKFKNINYKFYLIVSRLESYKKIDLAIKAFNKLKKKLIIVGEGNEEKKLKKISKKTIFFLSKLNDFELAFLYSKAEALIMPQEEDFGYVSLEAQFFNCPVIAYRKGGARETVINYKTGIFFERQEEESLIEAIERFEKIKYNVKNNLLFLNKSNFFIKFSKQKFIKNFLNKI